MNDCSHSKPTVTLWVRAGVDGVRCGGCPVCQQLFMILLCKSDAGVLNFEVKTTNPYRPNYAFSCAGLRHVPALVHDDQQFDETDEIIEYLDNTFPQPDLTCNNVEALNTVRDLFSKFCFFIKAVDKGPANLESALAKLNAFLLKTKTKFLCGDQLTHLDCSILPKLHHIRLVVERFTNFQIPRTFSGVWKYLKTGYECDVFTRSCPCDEEILLHWSDRPDTPNLSSVEMETPNSDGKLVLPVPEKSESTQAKISTMEFLNDLEELTPLIPEALVEYYMNQAGMQDSDPFVKRAIALAAQKFISDILLDSMQKAKFKGLAQVSKKGSSKELRYTLTSEVLEPVLEEFGIEGRKSVFNL
ncbi:Chloride intracellular channel exl-1 [Trichinella nativa]|uniref:Chloride intracellular channel exl-1 n=3 Tax=Trichinella TaxID=6333 RepID=A0A0V1KVW6_9BILA|nr:Chloride intracellular channel exl-1 [Trichinella murrelli]KRX80482.1 Chloride intracellular channel exl-1 [Trichinella sp. T6]KRZ51449.1 Chloride intracellular channel exl-1 [Trichinella nativa]